MAFLAQLEAGVIEAPFRWLLIFTLIIVSAALFRMIRNGGFWDGHAGQAPLPFGLLIIEFRKGAVTRYSKDAGKMIPETAQGLGTSDVLHWVADAGSSAFRRVNELAYTGTAFEAEFKFPNGQTYAARGAVLGSRAVLTLYDISQATQDLQAAQITLGRLRAEKDLLQDKLNRAPFAVWGLDQGGQHWGNARYHALKADLGVSGHQAPFEAALQNFPLSALEAETRRSRVELRGKGAQTHWFDLLEGADAQGQPLGYAIASDQIVQAESALKRFVETLSKTFAHLPIGLAIFDANMRLNLFNPALGSLLDLDPAWMAGRPTIHEFLEKLRQSRNLPDQRDFMSWRDTILTLGGGDPAANYQEDWLLAKGQMLRVTGRPYAQGAFALLFDDITARIEQTHKYRSQIELQHAVFDRLEAALVAFDASGRCVMANRAFTSQWGPLGYNPDRDMSIHAMVMLWRSQLGASPFWDELLLYVTGSDGRPSLKQGFQMSDSQRLVFDVRGLPEQASMITIRPVTQDALSKSGSREGRGFIPRAIRGGVSSG